MRTRRNKRKPVRREIKLPSFKVNWKAVLLTPLTVAALVAAAYGGSLLLDRPVGRLVIDGPFQRVTALQIEAALDGEFSSGFLSLDLDKLRSKIEAIDWIDEASIRRSWPDALIVRVTEHRAAARWGDTGLLNARGELFAANVHRGFPELPVLAGPDGSERQVAEVYLRVRDRLLSASLGLQSLSMDARGALSIVLDNGLSVYLGRGELQQRLDRFFGVAAPALSTGFHRLEYIDLRYTNGFAVGWREEEQTRSVNTEGLSAHG